MKQPKFSLCIACELMFHTSGDQGAATCECRRKDCACRAKREAEQA